MNAYRLARILVVAGLACAAGMAAAGDRRVLILQEDSAIVGQAADALATDLAAEGIGGSALVRLNLDQVHEAEDQVARWRRENATTAVVALGPKAIRPALQLSAGKLAIVAVVSRAVVDGGGYPSDQLSAIVLDQPPERILNLIQVALPMVRQIGVLAGEATQKSLRQLERAAQERHLTLVSEAVSSQDDLVQAAERLAPRIRALLAIPDPVVHNRSTVLPLLLATYRAGIPVVAYSESYLQAGAALALYSTPAQIAHQVAEVTAQVLDGRRPAQLQAPKYFTVGINSAVTRSLGLTLPTAQEIEQKVQDMER